MEDSNKRLEEIKQTASNNKLLMHLINKTLQIDTAKLKNKYVNILTVLNSDNIDIKKLEKYMIDGLPEDIPCFRSLIWKMLLGGIPFNKNEWESSLEKSRAVYLSYFKKYTHNLNFLKSKKQKKNDHPLSREKNSNWYKYFKDEDLNTEILKDIRRTRTQMSFFFMPCKSNFNQIAQREISNEEITSAASNVKYEDITRKKGKSFETNADVMSRILFIYGKLHPDIMYVQGMNELLATVYFCFCQDHNEYCINNVEADAFTCFEKLMDTVKNVFIRKMDYSEHGVQTKLSNLNLMLKEYDYDVYIKLKKENIEMHFFAFRWVTLLFTQDFEMSELLRLWDSILSQEDPFEFCQLLIVAILTIKRDDIINSDFSGAMAVLQDIGSFDINQLVKRASELRSEFNKLLI